VGKEEKKLSRFNHLNALEMSANMYAHYPAMSDYKNEESIYKLIPRPEEQIQRPPMYRSKYPHSTPPSSSTFGLSRVSQTLVTNLGGDYSIPPGNHAHKKSWDDFGPPRAHISDTTAFLKKTEGHDPLPPPRSFSYEDSTRKPAVTRGLQIIAPTKSTNFIVKNAVNAVTMKPKPLKTSEINYLKKHEYGQVPSYLNDVKGEISLEKEYIQHAKERQKEEELRSQPKMRLLPEEERQELLVDLKKKWEAVNKQYQLITHIVTLDTIGKVRRKEQYESQLQHLERSIEKLSKKFVFVHDDV